jgi:rRNA-processing protein FCF1
MTHEPKHKKKIKVILDSNALFVPLRFGMDINEKLAELLQMPFEIILLSGIASEMKTLASKGSPTIKRQAAFASRLAEKYEVVKVKHLFGESTDDVIIRVAEKWKSPVFTNDKQLIKKLRDINVPVIYVRQKSLLKMEGRISTPV